MIVDCAHYQDGRRSTQDPASIEDAAARSREGGFVWLGLFEPGIAELIPGRRAAAHPRKKAKHHRQRHHRRRRSQRS